MGIPKPLSKEQVHTELHKLYEQMQKDIGRIPNIFGVIARFPAARAVALRLQSNTKPV